MQKSGLWYLATPYTCKDKNGKYVLGGEEANFRIACLYAARLIEAGWLVYSPIAQTHPIHCAYPPFVGGEVHEMWYHYDNEFIRQCPFKGVILSPGWEKSKGCVAEKALFESLGREVRYFAEPCVILRIDPTH